MLVVAMSEAAGPWWTHDRDSSEHWLPVSIQLIGGPAGRPYERLRVIAAGERITL
jgi:hypothetical protein